MSDSRIRARRGRLVGTLVAGFALLAATAAPATAETPGVGTGSAQAEVLSVSVGDGTLSASVLADTVNATIDPARAAAPEAATSLVAGAVASGVVPALAATTPTVSARSTGGRQSAGTDGVQINLGLLTGVVNPLEVAAEVVDGLARATLGATLTDLTAAAGLASANAVVVGTTSAAGPEATDVTRGVTVTELSALDLGALLAGLGIPLESLPVSSLVELVDALGALVGAPDGSILDADGLTDALGIAQAGIDDLQAAADEATTQLAAGAAAVCDTLNDQLSALGLDTIGDTTGLGDIVDDVTGLGDLLTGGVTSCDTDTLTGVVEVLQGAIDALQDQLAALITDTLGTLAGTPLLRLTDVQAGLRTVAAETTDASEATVTASIGQIAVGSLALPGVTLDGALDTVEATAAAATEAVNGVLARIHPDLGQLVGIALFEQSTDVREVDSYVEALAALTVTRVTITPPATLPDIVAGLTDGAGTVVAELGGQVPVLEPAMDELNGLLADGGVVTALSQPTTVRLGSLAQTANFTVASGPTGGSSPTLPRTGGSAGPALVAALLLAAGALGIRRRLATGT